MMAEEPYWFGAPTGAEFGKRCSTCKTLAWIEPLRKAFQLLALLLMRFVCVYTTGRDVWLLLKYYLHGFSEDEEKALCCNNCCGHAIVIMLWRFYIEMWLNIFSPHWVGFLKTAKQIYLINGALKAAFRCPVILAWNVYLLESLF